MTSCRAVRAPLRPSQYVPHRVPSNDRLVLGLYGAKSLGQPLKGVPDSLSWPHRDGLGWPHLVGVSGGVTV